MIFDKQSLRITCRQVRAKIVNKEAQSQAIISKLLSFPVVIKASSILAYYPLESEIDILPLLSKLQKDHKKIYIPFFKQLKIGLFNNSLNYVDKLKAYEPSRSVLKPPLDVIIIPALAFDRSGYRLGQGFGWYDRFLINYTNVLKIGICFQEQLLAKIPSSEHDQKVDVIITSQEVINCH